MAIEIKLIGFGDDRPPRFGRQNSLSLEIETPASPWSLLRELGIDDVTGLVIMDADSVIPLDRWQDAIVEDGARLTLLSAFEGG